MYCKSYIVVREEYSYSYLFVPLFIIFLACVIECIMNFHVFNVGDVRNVVDVEDESAERGPVRGGRRRAGSVP